MKILKEELDENPVDSHYKALMCGLSPLANTSLDFKVRYAQKVLDLYSQFLLIFVNSPVANGSTLDL